MPRLKKEVVMARDQFIRDFFHNNPSASIEDGQKAIHSHTGMKMAPPRLKALHAEAHGKTEAAANTGPVIATHADSAHIKAAGADDLTHNPLVPADYKPQTPISKDQRAEMYSELCDRLDEMMDHYNGKEIPDRVKLYAERIYDAPDLQVARDVRHKTLQKLQIHYLALWSKHKIPGPDSPEACLKRSKEADNLANFLTGKGDEKGARRERQRAARMRARAAELRALKANGEEEAA